MRAAGALLMLLLCLSLTRGDTQRDMESPERIQVDVWAELRALRDMAVEQKAQLQTERQCHKTTVEDLKTEKVALEAKLLATDRQLELLESKYVALNTRLTSSESRVEAVEKASADRPKVAFSAALGSAMGPVSTDTVIVYDVVLTNIGEAYSPSSGAFTAPVKGVYRISFTGMDNRPGAWLSVYLFKNGQMAMLRGSYNDGGENGGNNRYVSLSLLLELEVGDVIDTRLSKTYRLSGHQTKPTTFSGFLLFPL